MNKKERTVVMIGGGLQEIEAVKIAQQAGYRVLVTDKNENAPCFDFSDYRAVIDGRDIESLSSFILLNKDKLNITGIFTLTELVTSVAAVAEAANLPGVSLFSAIACQNKQLCKEIWVKHNVSTPLGRAVTSFKQAKELFNEYGKDIFVKPSIGFGGVNSKRIWSENDLEEYFNFSNQTVIVEELLDGSMHDVNGIIDNNGNFHPMGIVDRFFLETAPVESKIVTPSSLKQAHQDQLYELLEKAVRAIGINWGPIKGDAVYSNGKFRMLEVAPRLHGPKNSIYLLPFSGFNCLGQSLNIINASNIDDDEFEVNQEAYSVCKAWLPKLGIQFQKSMLDGVIDMKGIRKILILRDDKSIIKEYNNSTDVPAYIFSSGNELDECNEYLLNTGLFED